MFGEKIFVVFQCLFGPASVIECGAQATALATSVEKRCAAWHCFAYYRALIIITEMVAVEPLR